MYVYLQTYFQTDENPSKDVWTVGFYTPKGIWVSESDYNSKKEAAERVHYLNGGN
ncbi:MAG: hypothetical protein PVI43_00825 [Candidatus Bathyarchaeota archaeon]|jgi:hypothetical protein